MVPWIVFEPSVLSRIKSIFENCHHERPSISVLKVQIPERKDLHFNTIGILSIDPVRGTFPGALLSFHLIVPMLFGIAVKNTPESHQCNLDTRPWDKSYHDNLKLLYCDTHAFTTANTNCR